MTPDRRPSERLVHAVEALRIEPHEHVLEIGCGQGVAASLVCERLRTGHLVAIDRSATMIAMAAKRNAACVAAGLAEFRSTELREADFDTAIFNKVFAIRVGVFVRGDPSRELAVIAKHLQRDGSLYLFYDLPSRRGGGPMIDAMTNMLQRHGWVVANAAVEESASTAVASVIASPAGGARVRGSARKKRVSL